MSVCVCVCARARMPLCSCARMPCGAPGRTQHASIHKSIPHISRVLGHSGLRLQPPRPVAMMMHNLLNSLTTFLLLMALLLFGFTTTALLLFGFTTFWVCHTCRLAAEVASISGEEGEGAYSEGNFAYGSTPITSFVKVGVLAHLSVSLAHTHTVTKSHTQHIQYSKSHIHLHCWPHIPREFLKVGRF